MSRENSRLVYSTEHAVPRKEEPAGKVSKPPASSAHRKVLVRLEKKGRGGKSVSIIEGLQLSGNELEKLLKQLKTKLGTGGTVKNDFLEIQGDHRDALCSFLEALGYKPRRSGG
ncbi:MAG TPA: hypothetical protein VF790_00730 [Dissulfurispiraceae bacterium]